MKNEDILNKSLYSSKYYNNTDLRMVKEYGFLLTNKELDDYLLYKENIENNLKHDLPLKSWNSNKIYYYSSKELIELVREYVDFFEEDFEKNKSVYASRNLSETLTGIVCSELEGTLRIEGVNTTRRQIESIIKNKNPKGKNDMIIINMFNGLNYIKATKVFNKETLKELYDILSRGCLEKDNELGDSYYRNDMVYVDKYEGCPVEKIEECMNSLFELVNKYIESNDLNIRSFLPYIAHYYILYIHPYFDYNGRTARMVQLWVSILQGNTPALSLSEAINNQRNDYYRALRDTRNSRNDLSYFLIYLFRLINSYSLIQKNIETIKGNIECSGESISNNELHYLKIIIVNKNIGWFNYKKFIELGALDITKQGALKILNKFVDYRFLKTKMNSKNEKIFCLNENILKYDLRK